MTVRNIYMEVNQHEVWMCECTDGKFYLDALQNYKVVHWNYPEITPTQEQIKKTKEIIENKKKAYKRKKLINAIINVCEEYIDRDTQYYLIENMLSKYLDGRKYVEMFGSCPMCTDCPDGCPLDR